MSEKCSMPSCEQLSYTSCHGCKPLTNEVNDLDLYMNERIKQYEKESYDIQTKINIYEREKQITHEIQILRKDFNEFKQNNIQIQTNPLIIQENLITDRVIDRDHEYCTLLATNNHLLLLHYEGTLLLVDRELTRYKQIPWTYGPIYDMCYSLTLQRFIIINEKDIFLLNEDKLTINRVHCPPSSQQWFSCTSLYLTTTISNISLVEFQLLPTIRYVKKWASEIICENDEAIDGIIYQSNTFTLTIDNDVKKIVCFELRSAETLEKIW